MQQSRTEIKQNQILWRHTQVVRLASDGLSEREIATQLKISDSTVHRNLALLKQQAKQDVHKFITDYVPFKYEKTLVGLDGIIKRMSKIIAEATDNIEIMQASSIKMQAYNMKMEMLSGANLIEEAIDLVERYQNKPQGSTTEKDKVVTNDSSQTA